MWKQRRTRHRLRRSLQQLMNRRYDGMKKPAIHRGIRVLLVLALASSACETPVHLSVTEGRLPQFTCDYSDRLSDMAIFRIPPEYLGKGGFPVTILNDQTMVWEVVGARDKPADSITYGVVPKGMREKFAAKPLEEGAYYLVMCGQNGNGGCYGTSFIVENGKAVPTKN